MPGLRAQGSGAQGFRAPGVREPGGGGPSGHPMAPQGSSGPLEGPTEAPGRLRDRCGPPVAGRCPSGPGTEPLSIIRLSVRDGSDTITALLWIDHVFPGGNQMNLSVRRPARRAAGAGVAALLLAAGATGCGAGEESPELSPVAAVAKAAKNTEEIRSLRYTMTGTVPEQGKIEAEASMRIRPDVAMSMKMTAPGQGSGGTTEIRLVDKVMYLGGGAAAAQEMGGKSWLKFDLAALGADKELNQLGNVPQAEQNPATESTFLTGAKDVKKIGSEKVAGVETTHYSGTVTLSDLRASLKDKDKETRERNEKSIQQYEKLGLDKLTMDMWVDGDDHTKRFRMRGAADKGPFDMTITFVEYNKPVEITAPPAKDVASLGDLMSEAAAG